MPLFWAPILGVIVISVPVTLITKRGGFNSKERFERSMRDLQTWGATTLYKDASAVVDSDRLTIDRTGISFGKGAKAQSYEWADVVEPFVFEWGHRLDNKVAFYAMVANWNKGGWRLLGDNKSDTRRSRKHIECSYGLGWDKLVKLLNRARDDYRKPQSSELPVTQA